MSWEIALMVASTAVSTFQGMQQARAQEQEAAIRAQQATEDRLAVEVEALEEEARRRRAFEELQASNRNAVGYDPYGSQSFLALEKRNEKDMEDDVSAIQFSGAQRRQQLATTEAIHRANQKSARSAGTFALLGGIAEGGSIAAKYKGGDGLKTTTTAYPNRPYSGGGSTPGGSGGFMAV